MLKNVEIEYEKNKVQIYDIALAVLFVVLVV